MMSIAAELRPASDLKPESDYLFLRPLEKGDRKPLDVQRKKPPLLACLLQGLEGLAQGMALFSEDSHLLYANAAAQVLLAKASWSENDGVWLSSHPVEKERWLKALRLAVNREKRSLVEFTDPSGSLFVATMPVVAIGETLVLASFGAQANSSDIAVQMFGSLYELTSAEIAVLNKLCHGLKPAEIAREHAVAVSTINTQLATIRAKTHCHSVNAILVKLSRLPMLRPAGLLGVSVNMFG